MTKSIQDNQAKRATGGDVIPMRSRLEKPPEDGAPFDQTASDLASLLREVEQLKDADSELVMLDLAELDDLEDIEDDASEPAGDEFPADSSEDAEPAAE